MRCFLLRQSGFPLRCFGGIRCTGGDLIVSRRFKSSSGKKAGDDTKGVDATSADGGAVDYLSSYNKISGTTRWESRNTDIEEDHSSTERKKREYVQIDKVLGFDDVSAKANGKFEKGKPKKPIVKSEFKLKSNKDIRKPSENKANLSKKPEVDRSDSIRRVDNTDTQSTAEKNGIFTSTDKLKLDGNENYSKPLTSNLAQSVQKRKFSTSARLFRDFDDDNYLDKMRKMRNFMKDYEIPLERTLPTAHEQEERKSAKYFAKKNASIFKNGQSDVTKKHRTDPNSRSIRFSEDSYGRSRFRNNGRSEGYRTPSRPEFPRIGKVNQKVDHIFYGWKSREEYNKEFQNTFSSDYTYQKIKNKDLGDLSTENILSSFHLFEKKNTIPVIKKHHLMSSDLKKGDIVRFIRPMYYMGRKGIIISDTNDPRFGKVTEHVDQKFPNHYVVLVIRTGLVDYLDPEEGDTQKGFYTKKHDNTATSKILRRERQSESNLFHPKDPYFNKKDQRSVHNYFETTDPLLKNPHGEISAHAQVFFGGFLDIVPKNDVMDTGFDSNLKLLDNPRLFDAFLDVIESPVVENEVIVPELTKAIYEPEHAYLFSGEGQAFEVSDF